MVILTDQERADTNECMVHSYKIGMQKLVKIIDEQDTRIRKLQNEILRLTDPVMYERLWLKNLL